MTRDFEGKTEQEAIDNAAKELSLDRENFDVEIVDPGKKGFFKKSNVKIRIHLHNDKNIEPKKVQRSETVVPAKNKNDFEKSVIDFVKNVIEKMGYSAEVQIAYRKDNKLGLNIISSNSAIIIGKKGKNLDALQLLANVYAGQLDDTKKIIVDAENYRIRHEEQLVRMAYRTAVQVKKTRKSKLLEPMNPFERRLIHTALNDVVDVETKSEGEGLYKQVRIIYKGSSQRSSDSSVSSRDDLL